MLETYISCLICGHRAQTLARHLKPAHGITADTYRERFPGARIRSEACEANRRAAIARAHAEKPRKGQKKLFVCPCGVTHEVGRTSASRDPRCPDCRARDKAAQEEAQDLARWDGKAEGLDYVVCQECGHRAESLVSHIRSAHSELEGHYQGQVTADRSAIRDKTALKGRKLSEETKAKMSANAGWNRGLTKGTDERVARAAAGMEGRKAWSKGLTKADHPSLQSTSEKLSTYRGEARPWSNGLKADLSQVDFTPFLDETGAVDRKVMAETLDLCEHTIMTYMKSLGLRLSTKYMDIRAERQVIRLEKEDLLPFALANGKIVVGAAMAGLGRDFKVIKRECGRHGLPTFNRRIRQSICLDALSKALGGASYVQEWSPRQFANPQTGHRFRFDGFFASHDLIAEFMGYQHWTFPNIYIRDRALFDAMVERDAEKVRQIKNDGRYHLIVIREDEPYADIEYLHQRLLDVFPG